MQSLGYRLMGRWIGHMGRGQFQHESIRTAPEVKYEKTIGWTAHYSIGAGFAVGMVALDPRWLERPTLSRALAMGVSTLAEPWLVMQPAARTPSGPVPVARDGPQQAAGGSRRRIAA
ncbi:DUF2938 family protein [Bowdeniella nasicola]|uniref:DUF2938 family protein n=1 Tax=Bowdeniella nasicola TaxID=208480 RepID=UPI003CCB90AA